MLRGRGRAPEPSAAAWALGTLKHTQDHPGDLPAMPGVSLKGPKAKNRGGGWALRGRHAEGTEMSEPLWCGQRGGAAALRWAGAGLAFWPPDELGAAQPLQSPLIALHPQPPTTAWSPPGPLQEISRPSISHQLLLAPNSSLPHTFSHSIYQAAGECSRGM